VIDRRASHRRDREAVQGETPLYSMAIRLYNCRAFIDRALRAALSQTYENLEIIVADDHSSDDSYEIAQQIVAAYDGPHKIVIFQNSENLGPGGQIERIAQEMKGDVLVLADSDDISLPTRVERIYERFRDGGPTLMGVVSYFDLIDPDDALIGGPAAKLAYNRPESSKWTPETLAGERGGPVGAVAAYRRSVVQGGVSIGGLTYNDDLALGLRALLMGEIKTIPEVLVHRRVHLGNVSGPFSPDWTVRQYSEWYERALRWRLAAAFVMRKEARAFSCLAGETGQRARRASAAVDRQVKVIKVIRAARRLGLVAAPHIYLRLGALQMPSRLRLRTLMQRLTPALAIYFLRRNPILRLRATMKAAK
jgi:glycosyltransferase involved in cell wall biosynthesis